MANRTATLQRAKDLMERLVNLRINRSPLPLNQQRIYPVAALANGRLLLSNGEIRQTPVMNNIKKMQEEKAFEETPQASAAPQGYLSTLALNIAVPAKQTGKELAGQALAFTNYLNSVLQPKLEGAPEAGLPAIVPALGEGQASFKVPFEFANLPQLAPKVETAIGQDQSLFANLSQTADKLKEALKGDFLKQIGRGETEAGNMQRFANLPLVQGYGTSYRLPQQETAGYARISANPFILTGMIR